MGGRTDIGLPVCSGFDGRTNTVCALLVIGYPDTVRVVDRRLNAAFLIDLFFKINPFLDCLDVG